jgi:hypothetical protein
MDFDVLIRAGSLVIAGAFIVFQHSNIRKLERRSDMLITTVELVADGRAKIVRESDGSIDIKSTSNKENNNDDNKI